MGVMQKVLSLLPKKASREERRFYTELAKAVDQTTIKTITKADVSKSVYSALADLGNPVGVDGAIKVSFPQTPAGFTASAAFTNVILEWNASTYAGHAYTEIFRAVVDDQAVAIANGVWLRSYPHIIADAVESGETHYYWIRFVNLLDEKGAFNSPAGTAGITSVPVEQMITELEGRITSTQLATDLATPIAKINGIEALSNANSSEVSSLILTANAHADEIGKNKLLASNNADSLIDSVLTLSDAYSVEAQARRDSTSETQHYLNAIITVNPDTGQVTLDALDAYRAEFNTSISNINQELDAINGKFTVKVWQTDIDAMGNSTLAAVDSEFLARSGVCSLSGFTNAADCIANNGTWTLSSLSQEKKTLLAYSDQGEANSKAYADSITTVVADNLSAEVLRVDGINTQVGSAESNITSLQSSVTAIEGENYTLQINNATSRLTSTEGDIGSLQTDVANVQSSTYTKAESDSTVAGVLDYISVSDTGSKDALVADALISNALSATNEMDQRRTANAVIISNAETSKANDEVIAKTVDLLQVNLGDTNASILTEQTTRADADSALATDISTVQTTLGDDIATAQSQATATASVADGLLVKYSVKLDVNGYVTGFAQNNNGTTGSFFIRADQFAIIDPASTVDQSAMTAQQITDSVPFSVSGGNAYIKNAYIKDLTADNLAANSVTADQINVADLSAVSANIGTVKVYNANISGEIKSDNYSAGVVGWSLNKNGSGDFNGTVYANKLVGNVANIASLSVDTIHIVDNAVTVSAIASGTSYNRYWSNYSGNVTDTFASVSITLRAGDLVTVNAQFSIENIAGWPDSVRPILMVGTTSLLTPAAYTIPQDYIHPRTVQSFYSVPSSGSYTFYLKIQANISGSGEYKVRDTNINVFAARK